jgi:hypothetical protein
MDLREIREWNCLRPIFNCSPVMGWYEMYFSACGILWLEDNVEIMGNIILKLIANE